MSASSANPGVVIAVYFQERALIKPHIAGNNEILFNTEELLKQDGLMFDGNPASPEAIESILSAMQIGMEMAKKKNKEKYTPQKYRKDTE